MISNWPSINCFEETRKEIVRIFSCKSWIVIWILALSYLHIILGHICSQGLRCNLMETILRFCNRRPISNIWKLWYIPIALLQEGYTPSWCGLLSLQLSLMSDMTDAAGCKGHRTWFLFLINKLQSNTYYNSFWKIITLGWINKLLFSKVKYNMQPLWKGRDVGTWL